MKSLQPAPLLNFIVRRREVSAVSLAIRAVTAADIPEWLRMRRALLPDDPSHEAEARDYFARSRREAVTLVAERDGSGLAGFVEVGSRSFAEGCESQPVAYIEGWYVDPDVRRQGVGAALIRAAAEWARAAGFRELGSDAELANGVSQAAHRALGFAEVVQIVCFRRALTDPAEPVAAADRGRIPVNPGATSSSSPGC